MNLFLSYDHYDREHSQFVDRIVKILEQGGHDVYFDDKLQLGSAWREQLAQAIDTANCLVYIMSTSSLNSKYCQWEVNRAIDKRKPLILLKISDLPKSDFVQKILKYQYIDFINGDEALSVSKLLGDLVELSTMMNQRLFPDVILPDILPERFRSQIEKIRKTHGVAAVAAILASGATAKHLKAQSNQSSKMNPHNYENTEEMNSELDEESEESLELANDLANPLIDNYRFDEDELEDEEDLTDLDTDDNLDDDNDAFEL